MSEVQKNGCTVLFVSHIAQIVTSMCSRAIWLRGGQVVKDGPAVQTVAEYLGEGLGLSAERTWKRESAPGGEVARVTAIRLRTESGEVTDCIDVRSGFCIELELEVLQHGKGIIVLHGLQNGDGTQVFSAVDTNNPTLHMKNWPVGRHLVRMRVPGNLLQVDTYTVETYVAAWEPIQIDQFYERNLLCFHVVDSFEQDSSRGKWGGTLPGVVRPLLEWDMQHIDGKSTFDRSRSFAGR